MVRALLNALPAGTKKFIWTFSAILAALSLLDILALGLLAFLLAPMLASGTATMPVVGITLRTPGEFGIALAVVCALIITKDLLAIAVQRFSTRRFAQFEQDLGARLLDSFFFAPWTERLSRNSTDLVRSTDVGVASTVSGVLIPFTQLIGEISTLIAVLLVLIVAQPIMALTSAVYFALVGLVLYVWILRKAVAAGKDNRNYSTKAVRMVSEMVASLKEITLRNKTEEVEQAVLALRKKASSARADQVFLGSLPRYVLEIGLIGGLAIAALIGYSQGGMTGAMSSLALFGVAGFRLVPSLTRFQTIMAQTGANMPYADRVLNEVEAGKRYRKGHTERLEGRALARDAAVLRLDNVSFTYPGAASEAVRDVSLTVPFGQSLALVGKSGSGKSTLVDIMLGLMQPSSGSLFIDDIPMSEALLSWRSRVGYVPQQVALFDSTIANNVALSWNDDEIDEDRVRRALERAQLLSVVEARDGGIWARVGEGGMSLSGGQRQRLGIARALYAEPLVLVMDEATSALDTATEAAVTRAVNALSGEVTVVVVAHRLATIRESDQVCFMRDGAVAAHGTFDEVVVAEPEFAEQAALAGLVDLSALANGGALHAQSSSAATAPSASPKDKS